MFKQIMIMVATLVLTGACVCGMAHVAGAASFDGDALAWDGGSSLQFTKAKQHAVSVNFVFKWGGHRGGIQKYMVTRTVMPQFGNMRFNAMTGTVVPLNAFGDFNPLGWTRRTQILTLLGVGSAFLIVDNIRGSHTGRYAPASGDEGGDEDDDSDSDSDGDSDTDFEHCYDGNGYDDYNEKSCY